MTLDTLIYKICVPIMFLYGIIYIIKHTGNPNRKNVVLKKYSFQEHSEEDKFVSEVAFNENLEKQLSMIPQTINQFKELTQEQGKELKLEFLFYTNKTEKAGQLATELEKLNYTVRTSIINEGEKQFIITGWTTKMGMEEEHIKKWTSQMCQLGYKFDCAFEGWGTGSGL